MLQKLHGSNFSDQACWGVHCSHHQGLLTAGEQEQQAQKQQALYLPEKKMPSTAAKATNLSAKQFELQPTLQVRLGMSCGSHGRGAS